jgi:hypothetical protein
MAVMGSGNIVVGKKPSARKPKTVIVEKLAKRAGASMRRKEAPQGNNEGHCGAMSQQRSDSGAVSTPQKFLRLVGCHETKADRSGER